MFVGTEAEVLTEAGKNANEAKAEKKNPRRSPDPDLRNQGKTGM